jgi:hypothetical protein
MHKLIHLVFAILVVVIAVKVFAISLGIALLVGVIFAIISSIML